MSRFLIPYALLTAIWGGYAIACGVSYGAPLELVGWAKTPAVVAGDPLVIGYTVTRRQVCEVTRYITIIDGGGRLHEFPAEYRAAVGRVGETETYAVERIVPEDATPGVARYRAVLSYDCMLQFGPIHLPNLFHQVTPNTIVFPDIEFEILPRAPTP